MSTSLIETTQREVLLEEAAKSSIINSQLQSLPVILQSLLGVTDIGQQLYGSPLTPIYVATDGDSINITKLSNYFTGLARDLKVADLSLSQLENNLSLMNLEIWARMQLVNNRSLALAKQAQQIKLRSSTGSTWSFTDTFADTNNLDMTQTTAWIDTSQGIAYLPSVGGNQIIKPSNITIVSQTPPTAGDFLGSNASMAFDSDDTTNWRTIFTVNDGTQSQCVAKFDTAYNINTLSVDPLGFGIKLLIDLDSGNGFTNVVNDVIYSTKTYQINQSDVLQCRISFTYADSTLPKVVGISNLVFYISIPIQTADIVSKILQPSNPFTQISVGYQGTIPSDTSVTCFYSLTGSGDWIIAPNSTWISTSNSLNNVLNINPTQASALTNYRGLFGIPLNNSPLPLTISEGSMDIGRNQIEISAFYQDWRESGQVPKILGSSDFVGPIIKKAWSFIEEYPTNISQFVIQQKGQSNIYSNPQLQRGGQYMLFQRPISYATSSPNDSLYQQLCLVPLVNFSTNSLQYTYNYRLKYSVFCPNAFNYNFAKYWFYQGFREAGHVPYRQLQKSYCGFSMYINDVLVAGDNAPYTIFDDNSIETAGFNGTNFNMVFNQGWNDIEIYLNIVNPNVFGTDSFDSAFPYVQLCMTPSLFDPAFQTNIDTQITAINGSGTFNPINEFDLLWNAPVDPTFWAWTDDRTSLLFNTNTLNSIDGYFAGSAPNCILTYTGTEVAASNDVQIKYTIARDTSSNNSPILNQYTMMTS